MEYPFDVDLLAYINLKHTSDNKNCECTKIVLPKNTILNSSVNPTRVSIAIGFTDTDEDMVSNSIYVNTISVSEVGELLEYYQQNSDDSMFQNWLKLRGFFCFQVGK